MIIKLKCIKTKLIAYPQLNINSLLKLDIYITMMHVKIKYIFLSVPIYRCISIIEIRNNHFIYKID